MIYPSPYSVRQGELSELNRHIKNEIRKDFYIRKKHCNFDYLVLLFSVPIVLAVIKCDGKDGKAR